METTRLAVEWVAITRLSNNPANPRINDDAVPHVAASLRRFGWQQPVVAKRSGEVIAGNTRLKAARTLGMTDVPVVWFEGTELDAVAYAIADNKTHEFARWDDEALATLLRELRDEDSLEGVGFDPSEIDTLLAELELAAGVEVEDQGPEPPVVDPVTRPGDLWILGEHRLLCGDSTSAPDLARLMAGDRAALLSTDPPYCVDYTGNDRPVHDGKPSGKDWSHLYREVDIAERRILIRNLAGGVSEIRAKSADNPVSLLGEGLDFVVVDEAARLKPVIWQSHLSQRLIDKQGWALLISTPKGRGSYYDLFRRGQGSERDADYESWNMPSWTNPLLDAALIDEERARLPERVFAQEYGAQFTEGAGAVFRNVRECATGTWRDPQRGERYYAGLDLAKVEDFTVLVVVNERAEVVFVDRFHRLDWALVVKRVEGAVRRYNDATVLCDVTGVGDPVYESLVKEGMEVQPYSFTSKSKSALVENLSMMIESRAIVLPRPELWPEGIDELEAFEYSVTESGNVRTGAPGGMHDDCVIATALAVWQVRPMRERGWVVYGEF